MCRRLRETHMTGENWTRDQLLVALSLYLRTPFGKLHARNPEIIALAGRIGRSPSAVAMKCCNFASLDATHSARGVKGLGNASAADKEAWNAFLSNPVSFVEQMETAKMKLCAEPVAPPEEIPSDEPNGPTEKFSVQKVRLIQSFFRATVLTSYDSSCAICGINLPELVVASHIIPWSQNVIRRADPTNGIALCALHDQAFDRGLLTIGRDFAVVISKRMAYEPCSKMHRMALLDIEGTRITLPSRFWPDAAALEYHRKFVFSA